MKTTILVGLIAGLVLTTGCVSTPSGRKTAAIPLIKDSVEGRYERPVAQVYEAAKEVIRLNGQLVNEINRYNDEGIAVRALEGRVQERKVFIGVKEEDPTITSITVQVRTKAGGRDLDLAHELEKQVALKLVR
jgi:hypothetical protein